MRYIFQTFSTYSSLCSPVYLIAVLFSRDLKTMWSMWVSLCSKNNSEQCFRLEVWTFRMNGTRRNAKREIIFNRKCDTNDRVVVCPRLNSGFDLLGYVWRLTEIRWEKKKSVYRDKHFLKFFDTSFANFSKKIPKVRDNDFCTPYSLRHAECCLERTNCRQLGLQKYVIK